VINAIYVCVMPSRDPAPWC